MSSGECSISTTLRNQTLPFGSVQLLKDIKSKILGKNFDLSIVLVGDKKSRSLNNIYRNLNKPANILSFPLSEDSGEIFINVPMANRDSRLQNITLIERVMFILIHGMLHLKGMRHGAKMEGEERRLLRFFDI